MPDLSGITQAVCQQILGGSAARELTSLEAAALQRVLISGLTISPTGVISTVVPPDFSGGGTPPPAWIYTGDYWNPVSGTAHITGNLNCTAEGVFSNGLSVDGSSVGMSLGFLSGASSAIETNSNTVLRLGLQQDGGGNAAAARLDVNDTGGGQLTLWSFSSTFVSGAAIYAPNCSTIEQNSSGGLNLATRNVAAPIRMYTGGVLPANLRVTIDQLGFVGINGSTDTGGARLSVWFDAGAASAEVGLTVINKSATLGYFMVFYSQNASAVAGSISQTGSGTCSYNTTSDARLKRDKGVVRTTDVLSRLQVHDFEWIADGAKGRGLFAQEAIEVLPDAVTKGWDDLTIEGARPWQADYSKVVPDLIVGWQQQQRGLAALESDVNDLLGQMHILQRRVAEMERI